MRHAYNPDGLRLLAKSEGPQWAGEAKAALLYAADVMDAADAVIKERDAEISNLKAYAKHERSLGAEKWMHEALDLREERAAQRRVLEQALEALKAQPIETREVWKDGIDIDVPVAHSKLCKTAITAIQEVL